MNKVISRNIRLGIFVSAGALFLIVLLYMIGAKRSLFSSVCRINARFHNVNGLMAGNNVRLSGINVGVVESVEIDSDTTVKVVLLIEEKVKKYIRKNAVASIGTDGLMGNKLVNITSSGSMNAGAVDAEDEIQTERPIETDEMFRTLNATNENIKVITSDLKGITQRLSNRNTFWSLLQDTIVAENLKNAVVSIKITGNRAALISGNLQKVSEAFRNKNSVFATLLTDSVLSSNLKASVVKLTKTTDQVIVATGNLEKFSGKINSGKGTLGMLVMDTVFAYDLRNVVKNLDSGTAGFNDNMEALKHSFFFKKYFKKQKSLKPGK